MFFYSAAEESIWQLSCLLNRQTRHLSTCRSQRITVDTDMHVANEYRLPVDLITNNFTVSICVTTTLLVS